VLLRHHPATILRALNSFPAVLGHENVAVVDAVGSEASEWSIGRRVCVEPSLSCIPRGIDPPCRQCRDGLFCLCEHFLDGRLAPGLMIGTNRQTSGSWAPFFVAHKSQLHAVPPIVTDEQAVLVDPIACALHGVLRRPPQAGERVLIVGGGIIGLTTLSCIRVRPTACHVTIALRHRYQEQLARARGADDVIVWPRSAGHARRYDDIAARVKGRRVPAAFGNQMLLGGFDLVYDCIGTGQSLTDAMKFVRARGTVVELGTSQICVVDTTPLWLSEVTLLGSYGRQMERTGGSPQHTYEVVFDLIASGRFRTDGLLTHTFPLHEYRAAFATLTRRAATHPVKVAFRYD